MTFTPHFQYLSPEFHKLYLGSNPKSMLRFLLSVFSLGLAASLFAQEADTAYGEGHLVFRNLETLLPIENVVADWSALEMEDTVPITVFSGTSDADGKVPFEVPVCIDSTVGLKELYRDKVKVFPVPGSTMNIYLPEELSETYSVHLFDMTGREVLHKDFDGNQAHISLQNLAEGSCLYQLRTQGETVAIGRTIKLNEAPSSSADTRGPKSKTSAQAKDLSDCEAVYLVEYNAPEGFVDGSAEVTIADGENEDIEVLVESEVINPPDTTYAYANGNIITLDAEGGFAKFVPLTLTSENMEETLIPVNTGILEQLTSGNGSTYEDLLVAYTTDGTTPTKDATYEVSWPFTPRPISTVQQST